MKKKNKIWRTLAVAVISLPLQLLITPKSIAQRQLPPNVVIQLMYEGIANLHGNRAIPRVYKPIRPGTITRCGRMIPGNAAYCKLDHSIYISTDMVRRAYRYGDAALAYIVGHEYAHAMQNVYGFNNSKSALSELQADCLAGFYMAAIPNIVFDRRDMQEIRSFAYDLGDENVWSEDHHGTPSQRLKAVTLGLTSKNISACF